MYIIPSLFGAALLIFGIYCLKMADKTEHWLFCFLLGLFTTLLALVLLGVGINNAFAWEEVAQGIINIVIAIVSLIIGYFEYKNLV